MKDQDRQEIIEIVQAAVRAVIREERNELWIDSKVHFLDHAFVQKCRNNAEIIEENRRFVSNARSSADWIKRTTAKTSYKAALLALGGFVFGAVVYYFKHGGKP